MPVIMPSHREAAVMGAAILAAVGVGYYPDIPTASRIMARPGTMVEPDPANRVVYDAAFSLYVSLYDALRPLFPRRVKVTKM
jgi:ribulose kinase